LAAVLFPENAGKQGHKPELSIRNPTMLSSVLWEQNDQRKALDPARHGNRNSFEFVKFVSNYGLVKARGVMSVIRPWLSMTRIISQ